MTDTSFQDPHPYRLAEYLTELVNRLRLSSLLESGRLVLPVFLPRLGTASRLLVYAGAREKNPGFQLLGGAIEEFISFIEENPGRYLQELDWPLELLVSHLETLLAKIDAGGSITSALTGPRWVEIISRFESAGTELEVMTDLEQALNRGELAGLGAGGQAGAQAGGAEELHRRWMALRSQGDRMFEKPVLAFSSGSGQLLTFQGRIAVCGLLLDSSFQRDQLLDKIRQSGGKVEVLAGPGQALELIEKGHDSLVLLGDNLEPTRNLEKILAALPTRSSVSSICCVLVSGSRMSLDESQKRADSLGAAGAWVPPFELANLQRILDR